MEHFPSGVGSEEQGAPVEERVRPRRRPVSAGYEPPRLEVLGTVEEITRGVVGVSDGLGPGPALS